MSCQDSQRTVPVYGGCLCAEGCFSPQGRFWDRLTEATGAESNKPPSLIRSKCTGKRLSWNASNKESEGV
jgi:hypothetical protein